MTTSEHRGAGPQVAARWEEWAPGRFAREAEVVIEGGRTYAFAGGRWSAVGGADVAPVPAMLLSRQSDGDRARPCLSWSEAM